MDRRTLWTVRKWMWEADNHPAGVFAVLTYPRGIERHQPPMFLPGEGAVLTELVNLGYVDDGDTQTNHDGRMGVWWHSFTEHGRKHMPAWLEQQQVQ